MLGLIAEGIRILVITVFLFSLVPKINVPSSHSIQNTQNGSIYDHLVHLDVDSKDPMVDEHFLENEERSSMTSDLASSFL